MLEKYTVNKGAVAALIENLLLVDLSVFLSVGIYNKHVTKMSAAVGATFYIILLILRKTQGIKISILERTFLNKPILLFLTASLVSVVFSQDRFHSQEIFFQRYLLYFVLFFLAAFLSKKKNNFRILLFSLILGACIVSAGSVFDIIKAGSFSRLFTSFGQKCLFGIYFLYILPFLICIGLFHKNLRLRVVSLVVMFPFLTAFLYHYSRGMWIALILSFSVVMFVFTRYKTKALITVAFFLLLFVFLPQFKTRLFSMLVLDPVTWGDRMPLWESAINIFKSHPFFGSGIGSYEFLVYKAIGPGKLLDGLQHMHASNTYLETLAEMGMAGLMSLLFLFYNFFKYYFIKLREKTEMYRVAFAISILAVVIAEITSSTILVGFYPAASFWCLLGMAVGREVGMNSKE